MLEKNNPANIDINKIISDLKSLKDDSDAKMNYIKIRSELSSLLDKSESFDTICSALNIAYNENISISRLSILHLLDKIYWNALPTTTLRKII